MKDSKEEQLHEVVDRALDDASTQFDVLRAKYPDDQELESSSEYAALKAQTDEKISQKVQGLMAYEKEEIKRIEEKYKKRTKGFSVPRSQNVPLWLAIIVIMYLLAAIYLGLTKP